MCTFLGSLISINHPSWVMFWKQTIAESVGDWYFNRKVKKEIDCPYPCNPTCYHMDFTQPS